MNALDLSVNQQYPNKKTIKIMASQMTNQIANVYNAASVKVNAEQCFKWVINVEFHHEETAKVAQLISKLQNYTNGKDVTFH